MKRRIFLKTLSLATISFLTGCSSNLNFSFNENEGKIAIDRYYKELALLDMVKISYLNSLKEMELAGFTYKNESSYSNETVYSLPWYIGPDLTLNKDEYLLNIYNSNNLLFVGHGLKTKKVFLIKDSLPENYNDIAVNLHFKDFDHMYDYIYSKLANYSKEEIFIYIKLLKEKGLVEDSIYSNERFNKNLESLIYKLYATYISYEISLTPNELGKRDLINNSFPLNNWLVNGIKQVYFKKDDFYIYNLVNMLCIDIINNYKEGSSIYDY